jgi:hypothetical protein
MALRSILYEMATGERASARVKSCLAKHPKERFQTVRNLKPQLKWIAELPE